MNNGRVFLLLATTRSSPRQRVRLAVIEAVEDAFPNTPFTVTPAASVPVDLPSPEPLLRLITRSGKVYHALHRDLVAAQERDG